jgi:GntR family transcriptional repressor for pyruvate dehydrogenase complex
VKTKETGSRYYESVIENIKGMIVRGELKQGDKIPSERELAERFNVSRVPIREALKILEYMGILDSTQGDGTYVRNFTVSDLINRMNFAVTATADTIMDLLELRISLECFAAYYAALRRTDDDIMQFRKALLDMREAKRNSTLDHETISRLRQLSHQFHRCLVQSAHNAVLTSVYENLYELLDISRQFTINMSGISYNSILAHEAVFNRIIEGDAEGARRSMDEHLADVRVKLSATLAEEEAAELLRAQPVS